MLLYCLSGANKMQNTKIFVLLTSDKRRRIFPWKENKARKLDAERNVEMILSTVELKLCLVFRGIP